MSIKKFKILNENLTFFNLVKHLNLFSNKVNCVNVKVNYLLLILLEPKIYIYILREFFCLLAALVILLDAQVLNVSGQGL